MKYGVDAGDDPFTSGLAQETSFQKGLHKHFTFLVELGVQLMMTTSGFSGSEVGISVLKVPSTTIMVTSLAFFGMEADKTVH